VSEPRKAFYERHKAIAVVMILVLLISPILGVFVMGVAGAALGLIISVGAYFLTPYVVLTLRGRTEG
jgi:Na+-driven multidrug efflux pump